MKIAPKSFKTIITHFIAVFALCIICNASSTISVYALENSPSRDLNVLVISIDPVITNPVQNRKQNASEYLGFSLNASVNRLKKEIQDGTNGYLNVNIVDTIAVNEFPTYQGYNSMTESQFHRLFPSNNRGYGEWYGWWSRNASQSVIPTALDSGFHFDYNYLISKCNLVQLKNQGIFDMVWVFGIDPLSMYETAMVGNHPFRVNGASITADCDNFVMAGLTFSRPDGAIESLCHLFEAMMNYTYGVSDAKYNSILQFNDISELNSWEQFFLCKRRSPASNTVYGVGQVHFSPNSTQDYEWTNYTPVQSYHREFLNQYPDIQGKGETFTAQEYINTYDSPAESHHVWWMKHFPHFEGHDKDGYLHNWWNYVLDLKYVTALNAAGSYDSGLISMKEGDTLNDLPFTIKYNTGKQVSTSVGNSRAVITCEPDNMFSQKDAAITALSAGNGKITVKYDGHELVYSVNVTKPSVPTTTDTVKVGTSIVISGNTYKVTGKNTVAYVKPKASLKGNVVIPNSVTYKKATYKVTSISDKAFFNNKYITNVTIGKYITSIGSRAFYNCSRLNTITIRSSKLPSIKSKAFYNKQKMTIKVPAKYYSRYIKAIHTSQICKQTVIKK